MYLVTNPHALYESITLLVTIEPCPLQKSSATPFSWNVLRGIYAWRLADYFVAFDTIDSGRKVFSTVLSCSYEK